MIRQNIYSVQCIEHWYENFQNNILNINKPSLSESYRKIILQCCPVLYPQMRGGGVLPGAVRVNVSTTQSPIAPPKVIDDNSKIVSKNNMVGFFLP